MDNAEEDPDWRNCKCCDLKFNDCSRSPMILPCTHRICLRCHNEQWRDGSDNPYVDCQSCRRRFYRQEAEAATNTYHPVKDLGFSLALSAIEMAKVVREQSEIERVNTLERHATELAATRKLLVDLTEKSMTEARTINHFYHQ